MRSSRGPPHSTRISQQCNASILDTTTNFKGNFSFPEGSLEQSMSKYQRDAREKLQLSKVIDEISSTIHQIVDQLLHDRIYSQITKIINEVLCIREQVTVFAKEGSSRQEDINQSFKGEIRKMKKRIDQLSSINNNLHFQSYLTHKSKAPSQTKSTDGIEGLIKDIYDFMSKNEATKLFNECDAKLDKFEEQLKQSTLNLNQKLQEMKKKQRPINENLRKQLNEALSKDVIGKEIKKSLKEHIRYLFDELVRSRKDIDQLREEMKKLSERQRELQFSQTLLEHKIA